MRESWPQWPQGHEYWREVPPPCQLLSARDFSGHGCGRACPTFHPDWCSCGTAGPTPHLGRAGELALTLTCPEGELSLVAQMWESWQADQLNDHPGGDPSF